MSANHKIAVIGAGGHARVVIGTIRAAGFEVGALFDDDPKKWGTSVMGVPVSGPVDRVLESDCSLIAIGVGNAVLRKQVAERLNARWATIVHPAAYVDPTSTLGPGTMVFAGAVVQPECCIGAHAIINTNASVDHNCVLGDYVQVAPGANLCGVVTVEEGTFVGAGSVVIENQRVGPWSTVGAGSVVVRNLPGNIVAVGCPAQVVRRVDGTAAAETS